MMKSISVSPLHHYHVMFLIYIFQRTQHTGEMSLLLLHESPLLKTLHISFCYCKF